MVEEASILIIEPAHLYNILARQVDKLVKSTHLMNALTQIIITNTSFNTPIAGLLKELIDIIFEKFVLKRN